MRIVAALDGNAPLERRLTDLDSAPLIAASIFATRSTCCCSSCGSSPGIRNERGVILAAAALSVVVPRWRAS